MNNFFINEPIHSQCAETGRQPYVPPKVTPAPKPPISNSAGCGVDAGKGNFCHS